jgi:hypothetical protein
MNSKYYYYYYYYYWLVLLLLLLLLLLHTYKASYRSLQSEASSEGRNSPFYNIILSTKKVNRCSLLRGKGGQSARHTVVENKTLVCDTVYKTATKKSSEPSQNLLVSILISEHPHGRQQNSLFNFHGYYDLVPNGQMSLTSSNTLFQMQQGLVSIFIQINFNFGLFAALLSVK